MDKFRLDFLCLGAGKSGTTSLQWYFFYDDLRENMTQFLLSIYDFLGVDNKQIPDTINEIYNRSSDVFNLKYKVLSYILSEKYKNPDTFNHRPKVKSLLFEKEVFNDELKQLLKEKVKDDVYKLSEFTQIDFVGRWKY